MQMFVPLYSAFPANEGGGFLYNMLNEKNRVALIKCADSWDYLWRVRHVLNEMPGEIGRLPVALRKRDVPCEKFHAKSTRM